jgi:hypothetical protein
MYDLPNGYRDETGTSYGDEWVYQGGIPTGYYHGRNGRYTKPVRFQTKRSEILSEEKYNKLRDFHKKVNNIVIEEYNKLNTN